MTMDQFLSSLVAGGPIAALLGGALIYQTRRAEKAETKSEALYERIMDLLTGLKGKDSHAD